MRVLRGGGGWRAGRCGRGALKPGQAEEHGGEQERERSSGCEERGLLPQGELGTGAIT
jgi:hypothetical protein